MKKIGIFICNFNKKEYLKKNIESLEAQTIRSEFDIFVVDNASSDGSADMVENFFPDVIVIRNEENLGGAGGFYLAQTIGEEKGYEYILLADNDIRADNKAVEALYTYMEGHADVGIAGAKVYLMDQPDRIWIFGNYIDFERYAMIDGYANQLDTFEIPKVIECQTVPACFFLMRTSCLKYSGYMPKENFIMWDDIEFCYRLYSSKNKVVAIDAAKVWHKTGGSVAKNHFPTYYYNRNKWHFFSKFIEDDDIERFVNNTLEDLTVRIWGLMRKGCMNHATMLVKAFVDYLRIKRGKLPPEEILPFDNISGNIMDIISKKNIDYVHIDCMDCDCLERLEFKPLDAILWYLKDLKNIRFYLSCDDKVFEYIKDKVEENVMVFNSYDKTESAGLHIKPCEHIRKLNSYEEDTIYIDGWGNMVTDLGDYYSVLSFDKVKNNFVHMLAPIMMDTIKEIRRND